MPSAIVPNAPAHIPAWKRLGLKLKSAQEASQPAVEPPTAPDTSKRKRPDATADDTPAKKVKKSTNLSEQSDPQGPITPQLTRKKSVTFTPETKAEDGDSIKQLFNSWVAEQKSADPSFQLKNSAPVFKTPEPPRVEEKVDDNLDEKERRVKRVKKPNPTKPEKTKHSKKLAKTVTSLARPSRPFLAYLKEYCESRSTWKFNKNHQNHLLRHAFDVEIIPSDHTHYLFQYVRGLQGGVRTRLRDTALEIKVKDQEDGAAGFPSTMADPEKRQREYDLAMKQHVALMTEANASSRMGYEEGILLGLADRGMEQRVAKRLRADRILEELASTPAGNGTLAVNGDGDGGSQKRLRMDDGTAQKVARRRKQRTVVNVNDSSSSDDSSDSEEDSSDDSAAEDDNGDDDTSSSSSSSSSDSESEEDDSDESSEESSEESDSE
ncbi:hypothetical protein EG329_007837 [Mollisiaceae sp. DMI_Dod_QoI]|nr:hypothetical protein EG329_007837 [Helotiales sp. DMI_Dod_QoI]